MKSLHALIHIVCGVYVCFLKNWKASPPPRSGRGGGCPQEANGSMHRLHFGIAFSQACRRQGMKTVNGNEAKLPVFHVNGHRYNSPCWAQQAVSHHFFVPLTSEEASGFLRRIAQNRSAYRSGIENPHRIIELARDTVRLLIFPLYLRRCVCCPLFLHGRPGKVLHPRRSRYDPCRDR